MYLEYFGMQELPFSLTPNTNFFLDLEGHRQALEVIKVTLEGGEGFIKIIGEVGTGKTIICRKLLNTLDESFVSAYIPNPFLTPDGLMLALAQELSLDVDRTKGRHFVLSQIRDKLIEIRAAGKRVVLLIDEAQAMPPESMEALRLLTNIETETEKLLQVVLFGQPELDETLNQESLRQLKQRVTFVYSLPVLNNEEVASYANHRLFKSGYSGNALFTPRALDTLYRASGGIPRLINILAHKSLLVAYGKGDRKVSHKHVKRAVGDTDDSRLRMSGGLNWLLILFACIVASAITAVAVYWFLEGGIDFSAFQALVEDFS